MIVHVWMWLLIAMVLCFIELGHPGLFFFLALSGGALVAAAVAGIGYSFFVQSMSMIVSAFIFLLLITQRIIRSGYLTNHQGTIRTNVFALQGQKAVVTRAIYPDQPGEIKVSGQVWSARSVHDNAYVEQGAMVLIVRIEGCHCVVQRI